MTKPWVDRPYSLLATPKNTEGISPQTVHVATEMSLAHNVIVRNLNAMYLQAEGVSEPKDISDFIIFCQTCREAIHHHHSIEEEYFFPMIEEYSGEKGIMEINLEQHKAFEAGVENFNEYLRTATPETYDGKKLKAIIGDFGPALTVHLTDEIQSLLMLDKYGGDKLAKAYAYLDKKVLETIGDSYRVLPAGLGAMDNTFEGGIHKWPPIPFFVPYLVNYFYAWRYAGSWRFSPCTMFGQPRELLFAAEEA